MQQRGESETQADEGQVFEDETSYLQGGLLPGVAFTITCAIIFLL